MNIKLKIILAIVILFTGCNFETKTKDDTSIPQDKEERIPYAPYGLDITYANWSWKYAAIKEFEDFTVTLTNKTSEDFKMVKYRIILSVIENGVKRKVFSKSYEYYQRLNIGDVVRIPIYDLSQFYMGVDVSKDNNWTWSGYVEDSEVINNQ